MKKITKIRLINWHYLSNETIDVNGNILLTGQNAAGKSTILDALTYLITGGDTKFNQAANDKGKRDLRGYVKCKLGIENKEYLRDGDVSGDIAVEFFDDEINQYFTIGVCMDAFGELNPVKSLFWSKENYRLETTSFIDVSGKVYGTVEFRKNNKDLNFYTSLRETKREYRNLFGSVNEDFFRMILKALAFKPISDVKEFIYQNILEEKEIDVTNIRDAIRSYKDLEATLNLIQAKINTLTELSNLVENNREIIEKRNYLTYLMKLFDVKKIEQDKIDLNDQITLENAKLDSFKTDLQNQDKYQNELRDKEQTLYDALSNDEGFKISEYLTRQIDKANKEIEALGDIESKYLRHVSSVKTAVNKLREEFESKELDSFANLKLTELDQRLLNDNKLQVINFNQILSRQVNENLIQIGALNSTKTDVLNKMKDIRGARQNLDSNRLHYPQGLNELRSEIAENLKRLYNKDVSVHIFCELIEISDSRWARTIESFLGNQRFILIVEPKYYDSALQIFARIKNKYHYGFGLVNTDAIQKYKEYQPNSLASIMSSENKDCQNYINFTCGNVIMCEAESELKDYPIAITNDGLLYRGYVVRSMNLDVQRFIGRGAVDEQKAEFDKKASELSQQYYSIEGDIQNLKDFNNTFAELNLNGLINEMSDLDNFYNLTTKVTELTRQKAQSKKLSTTETQDEYNKVKQEIKEIDAKKIAISQKIGQQTQTIANFYARIEQLDVNLTDIEQFLTSIAKDNLNLDKDARDEYESMTQKMPIEKAYKSCESRLQIENSNFENISTGIINKQSEYISKFNSNLSVGLPFVDSYMEELDKLVKSELVKYEAKVRNARETAELIFKEDFISKLRNNIMTAEAEISKINDTLRNIPFGNDTYEFIFPKSKEYSGFYDMLKSDSISDGNSIFTTDFEKTYNQQLDELFTSIASESLDDSKTFNKFTDYRTYMDYDIKISNQYGESMLYSKVFREKSGAETQVPFYVAIIASFVRIYTQNNKSAIGLVMLDEVFDKMDNSRMRAMLEFMCSMPLQYILSCPPQKMSVIAPYTNTTLIVIRRGTKSQVQDITRNAEAEADAVSQSAIASEGDNL
jgi:uncharacterized protein YPO0396